MDIAMDLSFNSIDVAKDTYFSNRTAIDRLLSEWEKYGYLIVAVDFDETLYSENGDHSQMIELIQACYKMGCKVVIFTCRTEDEYPFVKEALRQLNVPYDYINENIPELTIDTSRKIFYSIFFDDRCGLGAAYEIMVNTLYERQEILKKRQ